MFRTYALAPETIGRMMRMMLLRFQGMVTITFLMFGLYLAFFGGPVNWRAAGPIIGLIALAYFFIIFFSYRTQLRLLYSLRYEIDRAGLTFRQLGHNPLRITRADITRVVERRDALVVETTQAGVELRVPYGLARGGDEDFRATLGEWCGVVPVTARPRGPVGPLMLAGGLAGLAVLLFANSLVVILPMLALVIGLGFLTERRLGRSPDAVPGSMRMYNMAFSFIIFVIVMKSCLLAMSTAFVR